MQVRAALATAEIEVKWSGADAKLASQSSCAGGTVPIFGARHEHKCRLGEATGKTLKSKKANRICNDGSPFVLLSEANHLPAAAGASLRVNLASQTFRSA
jgi:hypothetical protein